MTPKIFLTSILCILACTTGFTSSAQNKDKSYKDMATDILGYINKHRSSMGLKPLVMNAVVSDGAEDHSKNMATKKVPFGHVRMDERVAAINKKLKQHYSAWAENVASGQTNAKDAVESWLKSPGHRENIEGDYNMTGIGIAKSADGKLYFTEIFIRKTP